MSEEIVQQLEQRFVALIAALDGQDSDAIIDAAAAIRPALQDVDNAGAWLVSPELKRRVGNLSKLINASRFRVNKLTDLNRQRADNLTRAFGGDVPQTYRKSS